MSGYGLTELIFLCETSAKGKVMVAYSKAHFSKRELKEFGLETDFVEENVYCPKKAGTLYGIHYQNYFIASKEEDLILQLT